MTRLHNHGTGTKNIHFASTTRAHRKVNARYTQYKHFEKLFNGGALSFSYYAKTTNE